MNTPEVLEWALSQIVHGVVKTEGIPVQGDSPLEQIRPSLSTYLACQAVSLPFDLPRAAPDLPVIRPLEVFPWMGALRYVGKALIQTRGIEQAEVRAISHLRIAPAGCLARQKPVPPHPTIMKSSQLSPILEEGQAELVILQRMFRDEQ